MRNHNTGPATDQDEQHRQTARWLLLATWIVAIALTTLLINRWLDRRENPNNEVVTSIVDGKRSITLQRAANGHYTLTGTINNARARFLVDTGASSVSVPVDIAAEAGLVRGAPISIYTANGVGTAWRTRIDTLTLGELEIRNATGHINPGLSGSVLLGMSVLKHYELVQRGDQLTIREP